LSNDFVPLKVFQEVLQVFLSCMYTDGNVHFSLPGEQQDRASKEFMLTTFATTTTDVLRSRIHVYLEHLHAANGRCLNLVKKKICFFSKDFCRCLTDFIPLYRLHWANFRKFQVRERDQYKAESRRYKALHEEEQLRQRQEQVGHGMATSDTVLSQWREVLEVLEEGGRNEGGGRLATGGGGVTQLYEGSYHTGEGEGNQHTTVSWCAVHIVPPLLLAS
jgi:hypothetical protein